MWGTFYGHSAYIQKTLVTCQVNQVNRPSESDFRASQKLISEHSIEGALASLYNLTKSAQDPLKHFQPKIYTSSIGTLCISLCIRSLCCQCKFLFGNVLNYLEAWYYECYICSITFFPSSTVKQETLAAGNFVDVYSDIWPKITVGLIFHLFVMSLHITLQNITKPGHAIMN